MASRAPVAPASTAMVSRAIWVVAENGASPNVRIDPIFRRRRSTKFRSRSVSSAPTVRPTNPSVALADEGVAPDTVSNHSVDPSMPMGTNSVSTACPSQPSASSSQCESSRNTSSRPQI